MPSVHIAVVMMVKNEMKRLHVTLESIKDFADSLVIYDTGSTDNTIQIFKDFVEKHNIPLHLIEGEFVDFSTSRNVVLDYADTFPEVDYLVLLDCNDELRGGDHLRKFCEDHLKEQNQTGFLVCQEWWSGAYDKYYNMRLVKARRGWRYRHPVHEWLKDTSRKEGEPETQILRLEPNIVIYQDRTQDDDKSGKRFKRDKDILLKEHKKDPTEPRIVFYLAQSCSCLGDKQDALYFYKLRTTLEGFQEERFHAFNRCGDLMVELKHPWHDAMGWYMKAFEHSNRVEPLIKIAEHYRDINQWNIAFTFINLACELQYPDHCILFVDKRAYEYNRWHLLGWIAFYAGKIKEGKIGCLKALEIEPNSEVDKNNLKFYLDKEKEIEAQQKKEEKKAKKKERKARK